MGVFADWAEKYHDLGINVIPIVENKKPPQDGFTFKKWLTEKQTDEDIERLVRAYGQCPGIAVICGEVSGISGFDFDFKYEAAKMPVEITEKKYNIEFTKIDGEFKKHLPDWTLAKKAKHGWTVFFKWDPKQYTIAVDRHKVRLFDFKASGYIVIPPSFHSFQDGKEVHYSWLCGDPMDDFQSLPSLDISIIEDFREAFATKGNALGGRHGEIFKYAAELCRVETNDELIANKIIQYDLFKNGADKKGPYFKDKNHVKGDAFAFALNWVRRIRSFIESRPAHEKPKNLGAGAWDHFFETSVGEYRKDILSKEIFFKVGNNWVIGHSLEDVFKSYAKSKGFLKDDVKSEFARFSFEKSDLKFLCDIEEYDGKDWASEFSKSIKSSYFTSDEVTEIFKYWGTHMFARSLNSSVQNRCLILKGSQGIGKDTLIRAMFDKFSPYYEEIDAPDQRKDWLEIVTRLFICHVPEFDQTAKVDIAFLKSLLTQSSSFFRESYGRAPSKKTNAASFISSVNPNDFLRDPTGNRRFLILPIDSIDYNYPMNKSSQLIAQFYSLFKKHGAMGLSESTLLKVNKLIDDLTPESAEQYIEDLWREKTSRSMLRITQDTAAEMFLDIAKKAGVTSARVRRALKAKGYQRTDGAERFWVNHSAFLSTLN
jgi:DNA-binding phage protein